MMSDTHKLSLSVQYASNAKKLPTRQQLRRWVKVALEQDVQMALRIVDEIEGRALNQSYRGKDYATNVLTFDYEREPVVVADLVLCAPVIEREAAEQHKPLEAHYAHLVVHGALHALGFDHERSREAERMQARESALLAALGHADPYAVDQRSRVLR